MLFDHRLRLETDDTALCGNSKWCVGSARGLLQILAALELRLGATRVFMSERDELPELLTRRPFEDVDILVVSGDAIIAPLRAVPAVHDGHDLDRSIAENESRGIFRAFGA